VLVQVWQVLVLVGVGASAAAFVYKKAPLYSGLANMGIWSVIGYGSLELQKSIGGTTTAETPFAALAFGNAFLSLLVIAAAATGAYGDESDSEVPDPRGVK
jgi:hypothetical protein